MKPHFEPIPSEQRICEEDAQLQFSAMLPKNKQNKVGDFS